MNMKAPIHCGPRLVPAAERRVRSWVHRNEIADQALSSSRTRIFLAISSQAGAGRSEVAQLVGQELGWQVFDKDLLDLVAARYHQSRLVLDLVDETQHNWVFDALLAWMDHQIVAHQKFVAQLRRVVSSLAAEYYHAVFVGRCIQFLLPRKEVIAVRLVAPQTSRVDRVMTQRRGIEEHEAKRLVLQRDVRTPRVRPAVLPSGRR